LGDRAARGPGLKRSEALQSLARDHHRALALAQRLRRADDAPAATASFLEFWTAEGERHFRIEEEVLLPCWALLGTVDQDAAARLSRDHLALRTAALSLQEGPPSLSAVSSLGEQLAEHTRFEDRELFPLIEKDLGPPELERLAEAVATAEQSP
jgi:hemerythrin-like domain-containing protein